MSKNKNLQFDTIMAARDYGINTMLFRNAMAKKLDLTLTESVCLTLLGTGTISTPSEISKYTGLTTGATTTMIDRLVKKGFIKRKANQNDRRGVVLEIEEEYSKIAFPMIKGIQKSNEKVINEFSDEELKVIANFLNKFAINLKSEIEDLENN